MLTKMQCIEMAWEFARAVAEIDKQLLSSGAVGKVADLMMMAYEEGRKSVEATC